VAPSRLAPMETPPQDEYEEPKPPPAVHEVVRVPVDEEGREIEAP